MSDPWRYCCPECGSHWYERHIRIDPEYACRGCGGEFDELHDKKMDGEIDTDGTGEDQ